MNTAAVATAIVADALTAGVLIVTLRESRTEYIEYCGLKSGLKTVLTLLKNEQPHRPLNPIRYKHWYVVAFPTYRATIELGHEVIQEC